MVPAPMGAVVMEQTGGPEVLRLQRVDRPEPGPGEVLVRVRASVVCMADVRLREGSTPLGKPLPHTLGGDGAGTIEVIGSAVEALRPGERVLACSDGLGRDRDGAYAEFVLARTEEVHRIPDELGFVTAAAVGRSFASAWNALIEDGQLGATPSFENRERVVISGASSGLGAAAVQIAHRQGATVVAISSGNQATRLMMLGAQRVVSRSAENLAERIVTAFDGRRATLILDLMGLAKLQQSVDMLEPHGRIVCAGPLSDEAAELRASQLIDKQASIRGSGSRSNGHRVLEVLRLVADGALHPVIDSILPLSAAAAAHERIERWASFGTLVLVPDSTYLSDVEEAREPGEEPRPR